MSLARNFRKMPVQDRINNIIDSYSLDQEETKILRSLLYFNDLSDSLVENSIGFTPIPLGLVPGFKVNNKDYNVLLATEEPSVIAALNYASSILKRAGGISAHGSQALTKGQIFIETKDEQAIQKIKKHSQELEQYIKADLESMTQRGGGWKAWELIYHFDLHTLEVGFWIDSCDSLGANLVNTLAEKLTPQIIKICGGKKVMSILSNTGKKRESTAEFSLDINKLSTKEKDPMEHARRIVQAAELAWNIPDRAVTHNKGIMNGISALALATGNDTRALEAAVHSYACKDGQYRGLTRYEIHGNMLKGRIDLALPLATVGGGIGFHPSYTMALKIMGNPDSKELTAVAASVGLAQNFAALLALTGSGLQKGHMGLHARRLAYQAGARGPEINKVVDKVIQIPDYTKKHFELVLHEIRKVK